MSRYARRTDDNQTRIVNALRAVGVDVIITSAIGRGFPDLLCIHPADDSIVLLEVKDGAKAPSRRKLTPAEVAFAKRVPVRVVASVDEALAAFGMRRAG